MRESGFFIRCRNITLTTYIRKPCDEGNGDKDAYASYDMNQPHAQ